MKQEQFVTRYQHEWLALEQWLQQRADLSRRRQRKPLPPPVPGTGVLEDADFPPRYRRLCQQLALARARGYSPPLVARLQRLMQQGQGVLYRTRAPRLHRAMEFLVADFPQTVRSQARSMWVALALFAVPLVASFVLVQRHPDLIHALMDNARIAEMERMYDPAAERLGRDSGTDWMMFGYYIMNNITIALRTFASGLLAGVGTLLVLLFNGVGIGAVAGHLQRIGHGDPFWRFVVGHGAFELTGIVIAGGAGLQLGMRLLAPGRRRRIDALVEGGKIGARLCLGVAFMLLVAAFIEAFWSSIAAIPAWGKYSVAGVLWTGVLLWLWRGGRGSGDAH
ncbi:stage II sporulation protein M [Stenotrophomonas sp. 24(2023)]|uniref:stage II sporulation protein M n=1 Tax=Stenotrophomonas sp. 24(2023) TaxID=3068324 RepID=UPI0027E1000F|nr:stage II sporulation protein M [Stenotrophomonas sp. 24(2023)]WMJ70909.1 stage II sporulation protein M [Stenotrophomonas sp. 24(2023)]